LVASLGTPGRNSSLRQLFCLNRVVRLQRTLDPLHDFQPESVVLRL
jgi:hypothetical protein